jgi:hypothetical protein
MGLVFPGAPKDLVQFLSEKFRIKYFVETGTYYGFTAVWASDVFSKVYTIERSEIIYKKTSERYSEKKNITFILGDSREKIKKVLNEIDDSAVFWLDAHFSGGETAGKGESAPIFEEINIIKSSKYPHFILIDDARLFLAPPPDPHPIGEYPTILELLKCIGEDQYYTIIYNDVIVCIPEECKEETLEFSKKEITYSYYKYVDEKKGLQKKKEKREAFFNWKITRILKRTKNIISKLIS